MLRSLACHALFLVPLAGALAYQAATPARAVPVCEAAARTQPTPVDHQLAWLLALVNHRDAVMTPAELRAHFHPDFLAQTTTPEAILAIQELDAFAPLSVRQITRSDSTRLVALVDSSRGPARLSLAIDRRSGRLQSVVVTPQR
jgi:hypothetical protein